MFDNHKKLVSDLRSAQESLYELAWEEIERGEAKSGLWAKAFASSKGDEKATKAVYIELRVQELSVDLGITKTNLWRRQAEVLLITFLKNLRAIFCETGRVVLTILATFSIPVGMMFSGILVGNYGYDYLGNAMLFGGAIAVFTWPVLLNRIIKDYEERTGEKAIIHYPFD